MKTIAALVSAACLCAPVAAQAQTQNATTPATAPKASAPSAAQPGGKPTRIGGAPGANVQALSGDSEGCPRGPNGEEECTVEVSGSSSMGGFGGGSLGGGGSGGLGGPQSCGSSKVLQAVPCTSDNTGGPPIAGKLVQSCAGTIAGRYNADQADALAGALGTEVAKRSSSVRAGDTLHVRWSSGEIGVLLVLGVSGTRTISRAEFQGLADGSTPSPCRAAA